MEVIKYLERRIEMKKIVLDVKELQETLGVGRDIAYALMRNSAFPSIRIGSRYMVESQALEDWLKKNRYRSFRL